MSAEGCKAIATCTSAAYASCILQTRPPRAQAGGQSTFEVVEGRQQLMDERFLARERTALRLLASAPLEILEVGGEAQVQVFLFGEFRAEWRSAERRRAEQW